MRAITSQIILDGCAVTEALVKRLIVLWLISTLLACSVNSSVPVFELPQPPTEKINHHWVTEGETLYAIAWRYDMDPMILARANQLQRPFVVVEGKKLRLVPLSQASGVDGRREKKTKRAEALRPAQASVSVAVKPQSKPLVLSAWQWPAKGTLSTEFTEAKNAAHKGIDISGQLGQPVFAANNGVVVYSGSGLPAYGKLLILKHSNSYLSAYAHNSRLLVSTGTHVKTGETIAEIGKSGTNHHHLHFEIRKNGRPVNPVSLLPRK